MQMQLNFLNNLSIRRKIFLIPIVLALPIGFTIYAYYGEKSADIAFTAKEQLGVDYLAPLKSAQRDLARYRDLTNAVMRGASSAQSQRSEAIADVDKNLAATETMDQKDAPGEGRSYGATLESTSSLKAIQQKWSQLKNRNAGNPSETFNENTQLIATVSELVTQVADTSNLTLDPDIDTYYLMDEIATQIPGIMR